MDADRRRAGEKGEENKKKNDDGGKKERDWSKEGKRDRQWRGKKEQQGKRWEGEGEKIRRADQIQEIRGMDDGGQRWKGIGGREGDIGEREGGEGRTCRTEPPTPGGRRVTGLLRSPEGTETMM